MNEREARRIAKRLAGEIGLPAQRGSVFVQIDDNGHFHIVVSADATWLRDHVLPSNYNGLEVHTTDHIIGNAYHKMKLYA